jgi:CubicO group peptidase (beta-lactamase class C family)
MKTQRTKRVLRIIILLSGVIALLATSVLGQLSLHGKIAEIAEAEAQYDLFSGTVLVARDGKIIYARGFGEADKEHHIPIVLETQFNISSIQKSFIATLIMQLVQEGKISLIDPLNKYFPDCPYPTASQIQIKHLLNHTSGLGDYRRNEEYQRQADNYKCIDDVLPLVYQDEPAFVAGERFRYSNTGVLFLKAIIEKVTRLKLQEVLTKRILEPLGMENTTFFRGGDLLPQRATAYSLADDGKAYVRVMGEPSAYTGGGIYTTVLDLLKFDQALYTEELLSEEMKKIMFAPVDTSMSYAYGWEVVNFGGTTVIYHGGASGGFNSTFRRYPEIGYTIAVLSNYQGAAFELANKIDCMLLSLPYSVATESDLHYRLGMHFQDREFYDKALKSFEKNLDSSEPHMPSLYQAARTRILGEFDQEKAIAILDLYIEHAAESTRPSIAAAWWRKGVAHEQLDRLPQAIQCHEMCLKLDPGFEFALEALARIKSDGSK